MGNRKFPGSVIIELLKICFVCNEYPPLPGGGIGIFVKTLAEALAKLGVEVWVIGYGKKVKRPVTLNGVNIQWIYLPSLFYKKIILGGFPYSVANLIKRHYLSFRLAQLHHSQHFDLVESYDFNGPLAFKPKCPLIVRLHGSVLVYRNDERRPAQISPIDRHFEVKQLQMADRVIAVSQYIGNKTIQVMQSDKAFTVIYNGTDTEIFSPKQVEKKGKNILFVGNVMWRKGVFDLIHAMPMILEHYPDAFLDIAGGCSGENKIRLDVELAALNPGVKQRIRVLGKIPYEQLPDLYNRAAVFVFPSKAEAFGFTCIEAMACARPVVATCLVSGPELVENGISGLLVNPEDPNDIAEKVIRLLNDPILAMQLGNNARKRVQDMFDLREWGQCNLDYYRSLI